MVLPMYRVVGVIIVDGERVERTMRVSQPVGKGCGWVLTRAVQIFNAMADDGTTHQGVWCYFDEEEKDGSDEQESPDVGQQAEMPAGGGLRGEERPAGEADQEAAG